MGELKKPANTQSQKDKAMEYFRGVLSELKKVHWPSRRQLLTYTVVVFFAVAIVSILMWIVDSGLSAALTKLLP
ncbi:preprotein translocase subunit SecE [Desulfosporosinus sp. HMP52]|uniref:Protein translocase subunit SecE n=1 Tax=Desulfosporosinus hippei DSM 8344 TaxID=1121419 RepID=A0A1G8DIC8_9FIRM|nr:MULTISPECIES: preprotein translocase subunit SecE [Desulfosporosinus]KGK91028.1 preprotein translocase subunit SecE [Desulfosporosinus sp. HMP52]SDH57385.1 preprotein translocase subunit SecE [Desulfosporosinus hippei DSM 8344]